MILDPRAAAVPPPARVVLGRPPLLFAHPEQAQQGRDQPADGGEEGKGLVGLPAAAVDAAEADAAPVEGVAAGVAEVVDEEAEGGEPAGGQQEVYGPVDEAAGEGEQPEQGEKDGQSGDDLGVNEAGELPGRLVVVCHVEVVTGDTRDDGGEDQLEVERQYKHIRGGRLEGKLECAYLRCAEEGVDQVCENHRGKEANAILMSPDCCYVGAVVWPVARSLRLLKPVIFQCLQSRILSCDVGVSQG